MATTTFAELKNAADSPDLVRKTLEAVAFLAPMSVELPATLTDTGGKLKTLPEGYWPVGIVTKDGYSFESNTTKEEVDALGYADPVRTDITQVTKTVKFKTRESMRMNLASLVYGLDLSKIQQAATGEIVFDEPPLPVLTEYRLVIIGRDGPAAEEWILGRGFPRVKLAELPGEVWGSEPIGHEITLDVLPDDKLGTSVRRYIGGAAALKHKTALGYAQG